MHATRKIKKEKRLYKTLALVLMLSCLFVQQTVFSGGSLSKLPENLEYVDGIVARVNGVNILSSKIKEPQITRGGQGYSLHEAIEEELFFQKAAERKLLPTNLDIEKQIAMFKTEQKLTHLSAEDFEKELQKEGLSTILYEEQLRRALAIERLKQTELSEKTLVSSQEVEEYYNNNPVRAKAEYKLALSPAFDIKQSDNEKNRFIQDDSVWEDLDWEEEAKLGDHIKSAVSLTKGEISQPVDFGGEYRFIKLVDKKEARIKSFSERAVEVEHFLKEKKRKTFEEQLKKDLRDKATIILLK